MIRPRLLDLFSGAGGAAMGYHRAGFDVVGVDNRPMLRYPFEFIQADALAFLEKHHRGFDAIHASPPCQAFCSLRHLPHSKEHVDLVAPTRALLQDTGKPYVIENVPGAPLISPVLLCGTMFGLCTRCGAELRRHRHFEPNWLLMSGLSCRHGLCPCTVSVHGHSGGSSSRDSTPVTSAHGDKARDRRTIGVYGTGQPMLGARTITVTGSTPQQNVVHNRIRQCFPVSAAREAMGIDWMVMKELSQAIPPAYTAFIGRQLMETQR
jgi:DNA (cytosine-5)-methyltransferase 1